MPTECSAERFEFGEVSGRVVVAGFDGGAITSDAGALLLGAADRTIRLTERFAACFTDRRSADHIEHDLRTLLLQRVVGIALGYEDLIDHDQLRHDPVLAVLAGKLAARRAGCAPLAGKSTLNRLELSRPDATRYHRISHDPAAIEALFVDLFLEPNSLNHSEVIAICSALIAQKPLMRWILVGRFPFLLIDESQDTNRHLVDALFVPAQEHSDRFALGLIGDVMQRIYADGKERIEDELPVNWAKPSKRLNHRCPKRVVTLINKIRSEVDTHVQEPRSDAIQGHVRLFIRPSDAPDRKGVEDEIRARMAVATDDVSWGEIDNCKVLTLEHHMSAKRLGFENVFAPLYEIDAWRTGLLDGTLPTTRFFAQSILPLIEASRRGDKFAVSRIVRQSSPLVTAAALKASDDPGALLKKAQYGVNALLELWEGGEPVCGDVLRCVAEHQLFVIPDVLVPVIEVLQTEGAEAEEAGPETEAGAQADDEADDPLTPEMSALLSVMKAPFPEIDMYRRYVSGLASFDTHQGVKGLEFERVMVIMDDAEARGFMFGYAKLLGEKAPSATDLKNLKEGKDTSIDRTRRLLYVTCSRAERSLALVAYSENPDAVKAHVIDNGWFSEDEIDIEK